MMRTMKPVGFLVVLAVALATAGCRGDDGLPKLPAEYFYDAPYGCKGITTNLELSDERGTGNVYELEHREVTEETATRLAKRLGFEQSPEYDADWQAFIVESDEAELTINVMRITYQRKNLESSPDASLSDDDMVSRAKGQLKSWGLLPKAELATTVKKREDGVTVEFRFAAAPAPDYEFGHIIVALTLGGEVSSLNYTWQEPHSLGEYPLISEKEAWERLQRCEGIVANQGSEVRFTKVRLSLEALPVEARSAFDYLFPVYVFEEDGEYPRWAWVPAVTDEYLIPYEPNYGASGDRLD